MNFEELCDRGHQPDVRTRDRVLAAVSEFGPVTAGELGKRLGLTVPGIRRHLDALTDAGQIEERELVAAEKRRGRPARAYVLAEAGHARLREGYDELAGAVLRFLEQNAGPAAVDGFARQRAAELTDRVAPALEGITGVRERSEALAAALASEGYAASSRPVAAGTPRAGVQLCQGHCPVQHVATEFPQLCEAEREAFGDLLGVHVQRLASLAHGDHVCTTFVPLTAAPTDLTTDPDASERHSR